ncbi:unnamed protein product [Urochloa humidicola]
MARPHSHLSLLLLLLLLPATTAAPYSSLCHSPAAAPDDNLGGSLPATLPWTATGHFSGGGDLQFAPGRYYPHTFYFYPRKSSASATTDPTITHLSATLTLEGTRLAGRHHGDLPHSVAFDLDGYHSTATGELCMAGSGSYAREDGAGVVLLSRVVLRLTVPHPANLSSPFVTGRLAGANFNPITLVSYAEDGYKYGETASCPPAPPPSGARRVLPGVAGFSCSRLKVLLGRGSYSLEYTPDAGGHAAASGLLSFPQRRRYRSMYINQMRCAADTDDDYAVRAYMVFYADQPAAAVSPSNYTGRPRWGRGREFMVGDEALVADGFWDASRSRLCMRACRVAVASSGQSDVDDIAVSECGNIGVSFWFPAVWSVRDRSVVAGMIWNATGGDGDGEGDAAGGAISVSKIGGYRGNMSDIKYNYTLVKEAKKHYYNSKPALSKERKGRFPGNSSYRDFAFGFSLKKKKQGGLPGYAWPVTIGSALVQGNGLIADAAFAAEVVKNKQRLLNVSYSLRYHVMNSTSNSPLVRRVAAEGVYDTKTGSLCMVACQQLVNGSSDCEVLVTVQFAPMDDATSRERTVGTISSLRNKTTDPLFFEALEFVGDGMYVEQVAETITRMDMESIMLVGSMLLSCVFTALQLRHVKNHPEALPATSTTMLAVLAIGYAIPLVLNLEDASGGDNGRRKYFVRLASSGLLELNGLVLRVTTVLALALQLRFLYLAMSSRRSTTDQQQQAGNNRYDVERSTLWVCLPLYALGAVVVWIAHMTDVQPGPALVGDLAAYAGLVLDGFLLPQVIRNALSGSSRVRPALSPWFYAGVAAIRAAPHAYDAFRKRGYAPSWRAYVYASPRDDIFGAGWDVAVPCGAALLAAVLFLQQRRGRAFVCGEKGRRPGQYEMVSTL